jgi:FecR-like protein
MTEPRERPTSRALDQLTALAQRSLTGDPPKRHAAMFEDIERRALREATRQRMRLSFGVAALAFAAAVLVWLVQRPAPALQLAVVNGDLGTSGQVAGSAEGTRLEFSDGTEVELGDSTQARVGTVDEHGAELGLESGRVTLNVVRRAGARWSVTAGEYRVTVKGTTFSVDFAPERGDMTLDLVTGSVSVQGPLIAGGLELRAGQRVLIRPREGLVQVRPLDAPDAAPAVSANPAPALEPAHEAPDAGHAQAAAVARPTVARRAAPRRRAPEPEPWSRLVAAGRYAAVVEAAEQRELARVYADAGPSDLQALADAARYVRRSDVARPALVALRERFAATNGAREAAFLLGRLEETGGAPARALEWYERYLSESPEGPYTAQALGRKLLIVRDRSGPAAAANIAREYLQRFPEGPYAANARVLLEER